jgi:hypothetical protein
MVLVEGDGLLDQLSERGAVDLILGPKVDRSTDVPRQSRVEEMVGVREEGALGEGQLDPLLVVLTYPGGREKCSPQSRRLAVTPRGTKPPSLAKPPEDSSLGCGMTEAATLLELRLGGSYVAEQFKFIQQRLVLADVDEHSRAPAVDREDQWAPGALHLLNEGGHLGPELGKRTNVFAWPDSWHPDLLRKKGFRTGECTS